jgi:hypothetical protein
LAKANRCEADVPRSRRRRIDAKLRDTSRQHPNRSTGAESGVRVVGSVCPHAGGPSHKLGPTRVGMPKSTVRYCRFGQTKVLTCRLASDRRLQKADLQ